MKPLHNDHRTRVTKQLIRRAFTDLLAQKPIQSITIKELCERAGINRGTFYAHYTDLHDLLGQMEEELLSGLQQALAPLLTADDEHLNPVAITAGIFQCLRDNSDLCSITLGPYGDKKFLLKVINMGHQRYMPCYQQWFKGATPQQLEYFYAFVSGGCIALLQKWLAEGMTTPPAEIAEMAEKLMLYGIGFLEKT